MVCANKARTRRYIKSKKGSTKRQKSQAKRRHLRRQPVSYVAVPKPLWKRLKRLSPKRAKGQVGCRALSNRMVLDAIWFVLWTSCQGKAIIREHFGVSGSTVHARFQQWQQGSIFAAVMTEMVRYYDKKRKIRWKWQAADGKTCPTPLGGEETGPNPTDRVRNSTCW